MHMQRKSENEVVANSSGKEIKRTGDSENPAYVIAMDKGDNKDGKELAKQGDKLKLREAGGGGGDGEDGGNSGEPAAGNGKSKGQQAQDLMGGGKKSGGGGGSSKGKSSGSSKKGDNERTDAEQEKVDAEEAGGAKGADNGIGIAEDAEGVEKEEGADKAEEEEAAQVCTKRAAVMLCVDRASVIAQLYVPQSRCWCTCSVLSGTLLQLAHPPITTLLKS